MAGDMSQCLQIAVEASTIENQAMQLDREGNAVRACEEYRKAAARLGEAVAAVPSGHPDGPIIERHANEVNTRVAYLESLDGAPATVPLEDHIKGVQLSMDAPPPDAGASAAAVGGSPGVMAAAAGAGGLVGLLVLGPVAAVALAGAAAVATTREDKIGSAARTVGTHGIMAAQKAKTFDENHQITGRVAAAGATAVGKAKEVDEKYQVLNKAKSGLSQAGGAASAGLQKAGAGLSQAGGAASAGLHKAGAGFSGLMSRKSPGGA